MNGAAKGVGREDVARAYRLFLGRNPSEVEVTLMQEAARTEEALRRAFLGAPEFVREFENMRRDKSDAVAAARRPAIEALYHFWTEFDALALLASFHRQGQKPEAGIVLNFLGTRIPPSVYPPLLEPLSGQVEGLPLPGNWHADIAEWAAALRTVALAQSARQESYRIVELGCGWGCWMVNMGVAARARGLAVDLAGVEGDRKHLASAREVLNLNGFSEKEGRLYHGVAGPKRGKAIFPDPSGQSHWGGTPELYPDPARLREVQGDPDVQVLEVLPLDALSGGGSVDLLHIDIQGGEADYVVGNAAAMERLVRRVLIGTHSRALEGRLMEHFLARDWRLEMERPALAPPVQGRPQIRIDGVQMWANPALA